MDLCGPFLTMSLRRSKHFAMFTNNCTRYMGIFLQENMRKLNKMEETKYVLKCAVVRHLCIFPKVKETNCNLK
ncbi:unnamed protein product [Sphagnum troendelagicum]|uniref:Uncharacterized protein n=1 Tax=Sphagnum troendelagicum TaxID=128251 RepID=A0ABP0TM25_9BRYO